MKKSKKIVAIALSGTMILSSVLVASADGTTSTGTSAGHVDKEVLTVTLPSDGTTIFNYTVDPEKLIKDAGTFKDGTPVVGNTDGVYFTNAGTPATYSSTSDAATFAGLNSVDVDVTVTATVTAGTKDITLVADDTALAAAKTPALLLKMKVGTDEKAITSSGATAKATITGKPNNFEVKAKTDGSGFEYKVKSDATGWDSKTLTLSGKVNNVDVTDDMTVPSIALVWSVAKHVAVAPTLSTTTADYEIGSEDDLELTLANVANITKVELGETEVAAANYELSSDKNTLTIKKEALAGVTEAGKVNLKITATSAEVTTGTELTCEVTFAKTDVAPSIEQQSYIMSSGNNVEITLDYGVGELAATGIKEITFVANGETKTCATSNYSVSNNALTFLGTYTSAMISNNVTNRTFTVVFNDKDGTSVEVTLKTQ